MNSIRAEKKGAIEQQQATLSIRIVVLFFGTLPAYFPLTRRTMVCNSEVDWLLVTDQNVESAPNVTVLNSTFEAFRRRLQEVFHVDLSHVSPYKLCDFRPAFGEIFAEELTDYDFWGHADLDVVFGNVREHITEEVLRFYDKVLVRGSFALYRNTRFMNSLYRAPSRQVDFHEVAQDPRPRWFDEWKGIWLLCQEYQVEVWKEEVIFDIGYNRFALLANTARSRHASYSWQDGELIERSRDGAVRNGLLIHLQKRRMRGPNRPNSFRCYTFTGAQIVPCGDSTPFWSRKRDAVWFYVRVLQRRGRTAIKGLRAIGRPGQGTGTRPGRKRL